MVVTGRRARGSAPTLGLVLPLLALMLVAFDLPVVAMLGRSVSFPALSAEAYRELFADPLYLRVIWNTTEVAVVTTLVCGLLGYPLAYWMRGLTPMRQVVALALVVIPFWISVLIRTYAWIMLLGHAGIVNSILLAVGLIHSPLTLLYNRLGVVIGIVNVLLPFLVLPLFATMVKLDDRLLQAARSLGASDRQTFWRVFFPLTVPALVAGCLLVFIMTFGFYVTPTILGGGRVPMLVTMLDILINRAPNWSLACAISALLLAVTLGVYALSRRVGGGQTLL